MYIINVVLLSFSQGALIKSLMFVLIGNVFKKKVNQYYSSFHHDCVDPPTKQCQFTLRQLFWGHIVANKWTKIGENVMYSLVFFCSESHGLAVEYPSAQRWGKWQTRGHFPVTFSLDALCHPGKADEIWPTVRYQDLSNSEIENLFSSISQLPDVTQLHCQLLSKLQRE